MLNSPRYWPLHAESCPYGGNYVGPIWPKKAILKTETMAAELA